MTIVKKQIRHNIVLNLGLNRMKKEWSYMDLSMWRLCERNATLTLIMKFDNEILADYWAFAKGIKPLPCGKVGAFLLFATGTGIKIYDFYEYVKWQMKNLKKYFISRLSLWAGDKAKTILNKSLRKVLHMLNHL